MKNTAKNTRIRRIEDELPGPFKVLIVAIPQKEGGFITKEITDGIIFAAKLGNTTSKVVIDVLNRVVVCGGNAEISSAKYA